MDRSTLKYAKTHEWLDVDGDTATLGITDFAVKALTDLVYIDLPKVGSLLSAGEPFGEVESVKAVSDIYAPIAGEVIEVNNSLPDDLDALSEDPFGRGWMIKIRITDASGLNNLLVAEEYKAHCATETH